ncbi:lysoplasmalogenase [Sphingobacteruim zhuxiongii]|nr:MULTISPECIES: lysoplasmalogenase [unclassified Sphingobacterium]
MATKPLICVVLIAYLFQATRLKSTFQKLVAVGLAFGLIGDIFLMLPNKFLFGLGAFLIGHICYVVAFYKQVYFIQLNKHKIRLLIALILSLYSYNFYNLLSPSLGIEKYPVILYIFVIAMMGYFAFLRKYQTNLWSFLAIMIGAVLFIISDSILAANKFVAYIANSGLIIMGTYMLAQYGITLGTVLDNSRKAIPSSIK